MNKQVETRVVPMDGYHYYRKELDTFPDAAEAHRRRGAPFTFNANRFATELRQGRLAMEVDGKDAVVRMFNRPL